MELKKKATQKIKQMEKDIFAMSSEDPSISLFNGNTGLILFYYHLYRCFGEEAYLRKCGIIAEKVMQLASRDLTTLSYCDGLGGIGMLFNYLQQQEFIDEGSDDFLLQCDSILLVALKRMLEKQDLDFMHGATGLILYFLERKKHLPAIFSILYEVIDAALDNAIFNCGIAHGWISIMMILSRYADETQDLQAKIRLKKITDILLTHKSSDAKTLAIYPSIVDGTQKNYNVPLGWCYGDTIIATALYRTGTTLGDQNFMEEATALAIHAANRNTEKNSGILDACFCHGGAGVAHIFRKWYTLTGNTFFQDHYQDWINSTLVLSSFEDGVGGYKKYTGATYAAKYPLLDGAAGVALVLTDMISDTPVDWDRFFLLS
jgi:lantibiotic modifying enzyme